MPNPRENRGTDAPMKKRINRRRKKVCVFCADTNNVIDYKDANKLKRFVSERGKIAICLALLTATVSAL